MTDFIRKQNKTPLQESQLDSLKKYMRILDFTIFTASSFDDSASEATKAQDSIAYLDSKENAVTIPTRAELIDFITYQRDNNAKQQALIDALRVDVDKLRTEFNAHVTAQNAINADIEARVKALENPAP